MIGVLANTIAVLVGSTIGLLCKKGIPKKFSDAIMTGIALCTVYIGISGALKGENTIVLILSMVILPLRSKKTELPLLTRNGSSTFL